MSLLQNEILLLESKLRELDMHDEEVHWEESRDERPRKRLPDIQRVGEMQPGTKNSKFGLVT